MANIIDYLEWRGDLSMEADSFNEVDNLLFSQISYVDFEEIVGGIASNQNCTIGKAFTKYKKLHKLTKKEKNEDKKQFLARRRGLESFEKMSLSARMKDMTLTCYESYVDFKTETQFAAITVLMTEDSMYVAFRGTDNTIVGWKEDFNMFFSHHVQAQLDALDYLNKVAKLYPERKIIVGGHSKGGNLAVYASVMCSQEIKDRIVKVYNNDGPGFRREMLERTEYQEMLPKIHTIVPESSIVGMLLEHEEEYTIVASSQSGGLQHDGSSWEVMGKNFVYLEKTSKASQTVDRAITSWISDMTEEQMKIVVDSLFTVLDEAEISTIEDFQKDPIRNTRIIVKGMKELDETARKNILKTLNDFVREGNKAIRRKK